MRAKAPFTFYTSSQLIEITGRKAANLLELSAILKEVDDSSIFYHVHHAFREHTFAPGLYHNDFAHWAAEELSENVLAERLANIDIKDYTELNSLRVKIVEIIENYLKINPERGQLAARHKFYFCKNIGVIQKTGLAAWDLAEFCAGLRQVGLRSLFFHFFEARLRLGHKTNDFSDWLTTNFGAEKAARQIEALDPYIYTMDQLRDRIIGLVSGRQENIFDRIIRWLKAK